MLFGIKLYPDLPERAIDPADGGTLDSLLIPMGSVCMHNLSSLILTLIK